MNLPEETTTPLFCIVVRSRATSKYIVWTDNGHIHAVCDTWEPLQEHIRTHALWEAPLNSAIGSYVLSKVVANA